MVVLTFQQYMELYPTDDIPEDEFATLAVYASILLDEMTMNRVATHEQFEVLPVWIQSRLTQALAMQINLLWAQGGLATVQGWGAASNYNQERIGQYQYTDNVLQSSISGTLQTLNGVPIAPLLVSLLLPTGLLYRGVGVRCQ